MGHQPQLRPPKFHHVGLAVSHIYVSILLRFSGTVRSKRMVYLPHHRSPSYSESCGSRKTSRKNRGFKGLVVIYRQRGYFTIEFT